MTSASDPALPISYDVLEELAGALKPDAFGLAVRLIAYQAKNSVGMEERAAPALLAVHKRTWARLSKELAKVFRVVDGRWIYPHPLETSVATVERKPARARFQGTLFDLSAARRNAPADRTPLNARTIASLAFEQGISLLMKAGRSEVAARSLIGRFRKDYEDAYVIAAIDSVMKKNDVTDPGSWMQKHLQRYPVRAEAAAARDTGYAGRKPPRSVPASKPHPTATPEFLNVSEQTAERIRQRNADRRTRFNYEEAGEAAAS